MGEWTKIFPIRRHVKPTVQPPAGPRYLSGLVDMFLGGPPNDPVCCAYAGHKMQLRPYWCVVRCGALGASIVTTEYVINVM